MARALPGFEDIISDQGLRTLTEQDFDLLPFGSIRLDRVGRVALYNAAEATLAQRDAKDTLGRHFFEEIAPCTNNARFRGQLDLLVADPKRRSARFDYRFLFPWGTRAVRIQLWVPNPDERWIFVLPQEGEAK